MKCTICNNEHLTLLSSVLRNSTGEVYYCPQCDLGILRSAPKDVKKYYDEEYRKKFVDDLSKAKTNVQEIFDFRKDFQEDRIKIMKRYFNTNKRLLEIGCSAGQFLTHVHAKYKECVGIEFDQQCAAFTEQKFSMKVYTQELKACGFPAASFDHVAAFQVLEHTVDPVEFLKDIRSVLTNDGLVFIEVPNLHDPLLKLWDIPAYKKFYYHEAHTHYFTRKSLEKTCAKAGLKIQKMFFLQDYNLFNHLYWFFNDHPQKDCLFGLSAPKIPFSKEYAALGAQLNKFFAKIDTEYKHQLSKHECTSNIFFIASKK